MVIINMVPNGDPISDFQMEEFALNLPNLYDSSQTVDISNYDLLLMIQTLICEQKLDHSKIALSWRGTPINLDEMGRAVDAPDEYYEFHSRTICRFTSALLERIKSQQVGA